MPFSLFFLFIDLYFLIPAVIEEKIKPTSELLLAIVIPIKEAKAETEAYTVTTESTRSKRSISFCGSYPFNYFGL